MQAFHKIQSRLISLDQANIDTDQIIPARFLKTTDKSGLGTSLFYDWRYTADGQARPDQELNRRQRDGVQILLAGPNFGCGSSREHAVWALQDYGFRVIVAPSMGDIFKSNALKNGLLAIEVGTELYTKLLAHRDEEFVVDLEQMSFGPLRGPHFPFGIEAFARTCLLQGVDALGYLMQQEAQIYAYEQRRPLC